MIPNINMHVEINYFMHEIFKECMYKTNKLSTFCRFSVPKRLWPYNSVVIRYVNKDILRQLSEFIGMLENNMNWGIS